MKRRNDWVVIILALGLSVAVICVTVGVLYDAIFSEGPGLSDNATQLLTTAFGGIVGVLGSYVGFRAANGNASADHAPPVGRGEEQSAQHDEPAAD